MSQPYRFAESINLHVDGRISAADAERQARTAREILNRLRSQPGVILADEVGMGKTFVALSAAVSVTLNDERDRQVVVMVPPSLKEKWPRDFELFRERCLPPELKRLVKAGAADSAVDFLKLLDDEGARRKSILFVTHGAMSKGLTDRWVKLALMQRALKGRHGTDKLKDTLDRRMGGLLRAKSENRDGTGLWRKLLDADPARWLKILQREGIDPEGDDDPHTDDDPVPQLVLDVLSELRAADTAAVYEVLLQIPQRDSKHLDERLKAARQLIQQQLREMWSQCLGRIKTKLTLPLLILDEAHHLKNSETRLASLFRDKDADSDAKELGSGSLAGVFERMIFLTATPFQLGHQELCSVLDRFAGTAWSPSEDGGESAAPFRERMDALRNALDRAQISTAALDQAWGRLRPIDLTVGDQVFATADEWWVEAESGGVLTLAANDVRDRYQAAERDMREAERQLKPWVIRHLKPRQLPAPHESVARRHRWAGGGTAEGAGIGLTGQSILPFLLAARASAHAPASRPVFAEGLASSYEAFLDTRSRNLARQSPGTDADDDLCHEGPELGAQDPAAWHLNELCRILPRGDWRVSASHPKIAGTLEQVLDLWRRGEKVVVFCHYIATGRTLRQVVSRSIREEINLLAARKLGCDVSEAAVELERLGKEFFDTDSRLRAQLDDRVAEIVRAYPNLTTRVSNISDIVRRNFRTPSFLARFFPFGFANERDALDQALSNVDGSGLSFRSIIAGFCHFLSHHCGENDREKYLSTLARVQVGSHVATKTSESYSSEEIDGEEPESLMPNVRLVNGKTSSETRQRLMLAFNTPFYPEVLIASSVLAEGVDLHLNSRHVIHHDLCWNPSTLEQRTGRVDRIGAKAERCGQPIQVSLPYIAETQDEKMYRVVMDRERWFQVVMGENYRLDLRSTEELAERVPFPEAAAKRLAFALNLF